MNLAVCDVSAANPVPIDRSQLIQSKFAIGLKPYYRARITISDDKPIDQFR